MLYMWLLFCLSCACVVFLFLLEWRYKLALNTSHHWSKFSVILFLVFGLDSILVIKRELILLSKFLDKEINDNHLVSQSPLFSFLLFVFFFFILNVWILCGILYTFYLVVYWLNIDIKSTVAYNISGQFCHVHLIMCSLSWLCFTIKKQTFSSRFLYMSCYYAFQLIIACRKGGTSIEDLAEKFPDMIIKVSHLRFFSWFTWKSFLKY